jgi:hypothetical protein
MSLASLNYRENLYFKEQTNLVQGHTPLISATKKADIGRITVQGQCGHNFARHHRNPEKFCFLVCENNNIVYITGFLMIEKSSNMHEILKSYT